MAPSTLDCLSGRVVHGVKPGPTPYLTTKEEKELAEYLVLSAKVGYDNESALVSNDCSTFVTGPEKTGLIYTKYTYSYYGVYLFFCVCYPNSVSFIEFFRILCIYDELCLKILFCSDEILHFKDRNLGQILRVDKTCFLRPGHIYS